MKKIMMTVAGLVVGAFLLAGCATAPPLPTKTGKPDVTIQASKSTVFDALTAELLNNGYMLRSVNETKDIAIYFIQHRDMPLPGWQSAPVDERVTVNFVQTSTGVRVLGGIAYIAYPGSGREHVVRPGYFHDEEGQANHRLYNSFLRVQQNLEKK
jgi:hypothetical protein